MNITFLIGNGFDLNLGLRTKYSDFYNYYIKNSPENILTNLLKDKYDLWADLELGLGKILKDIDEEQIEEFLDSKENLEFLLIKYLEIENSKFKITDEKKFNEEFRKKILGFSEGFCTEAKTQLSNIITHTKDVINYQFITFNYTDVLDKMIEVVKKTGEFSSHYGDGSKYIDNICMPIHLHGTLSGEDLILCVDNSTQINNESLKSDNRIINYMIKTNVNKSLGERKTEKVRTIINNSKYICLYGLSIGDTDSTWWKYIIEWLNKSDTNRLVLFVWDNTKIQRSGAGKVRYDIQKRRSFTDKGGCTDDKIFNNISNKIIVVKNSQIFTYKNVSTEENNNGQTENAHAEQG